MISCVYRQQTWITFLCQLVKHVTRTTFLAPVFRNENILTFTEYILLYLGHTAADGAHSTSSEIYLLDCGNSMYTIYLSVQSFRSVIPGLITRSIISADEDLRLRIESFAMMNVRGVFTRDIVFYRHAKFQGKYILTDRSKNFKLLLSILFIHYRYQIKKASKIKRMNIIF
jgi:hypothetical protein